MKSWRETEVAETWTCWGQTKFALFGFTFLLMITFNIDLISKWSKQCIILYILSLNSTEKTPISFLGTDMLWVFRRIQWNYFDLGDVWQILPRRVKSKNVQEWNHQEIVVFWESIYTISYFVRQLVKQYHMTSWSCKSILPRFKLCASAWPIVV